MSTRIDRATGGDNRDRPQAARPGAIGRLGGIGLFVGLVAIGGCGSDEASVGITLVASETEAAADPEEGLGYAFEGDDVTVDAPTLTLQAGREVTLTLVNRAGQFSDVRGSHDLAVVPILDDLYTDVATRKIDDEVLWDARTDQIFTDDSTTISFVPETPGTYQYVCTIPGHAKLGMIGTLIVEE